MKNLGRLLSALKKAPIYWRWLRIRLNRIRRWWSIWPPYLIGLWALLIILLLGRWLLTDRPPFRLPEFHPVRFFKNLVEALTDIVRYTYQDVLPYWRELIVVFILLWIAWKMLDLLLAWTSRRTVIATVNHKERVYYPKTLNSMYLVFTDKGVFRNQDSWAFLSFNSSDTYSRIEAGSTYKFTIYLYRNRWNSEYPNVLKVEEMPVKINVP